MGEPIRLHVQERFFATLTSLDPGYTLTDGPDSFFVRVDLVKETESARGLFSMLRDSNGKKVAIDVGTITYSPDGVTVSGPHDVYEAEDGVRTFPDH